MQTKGVQEQGARDNLWT